MDDAQKLSSLRQQIRVPDYFTALNFVGEKERFFKRKDYNPQFKYPAIPIDKFKQLKEKIGKFSFAGRPQAEQKILLREVKQLQFMLKMILNRNQPQLSNSSSAFFC